MRRAGVAPRGGGDHRGGRDRGERRPERDDFGAPRRISLPADAPSGGEAADEANLTPDQVLAKKIEEMKRRLARPD
jgi:hypothetical protein